MSDDPYVYPDTDVLRNTRDIRDATGLRWSRRSLTYLRQDLQLASEPIPGDYDLPHLQAFPPLPLRRALQWAGELRTVVLAKADLFCLPEHIESYGTEIFGHLAAGGSAPRPRSAKLR